MKRLVIHMIFIQFWLQGCQCKVRERYFQNGTSVLCKGITCPRNHIFEPCINGNGRDDFCVPCPSDRPISIESFDSADFEEPPDGVCTDPKEKCRCSLAETKLINPDECFQTLNPVCNCNVELGYYQLRGHPNICMLTPFLCKPGYQLSLDGQCLPCSVGRYKETEGFHLCIKQPPCPKNEELDFHGNTVKRRTCKLHIRNTFTVKASKEKDLQIVLGAGVGALAGFVLVLSLVVFCRLYRRKVAARKNHIFEPYIIDNGRDDFCVPCPSDRPISVESFDSADFEEPPDGVCTDPKEKCTCSVELNVNSIPSSGLPSSNLGIDSQMPSTGAAALNNQAALSLGDFDSDSGIPTDEIS